MIENKIQQAVQEAGMAYEKKVANNIKAVGDRGWSPGSILSTKTEYVHPEHPGHTITVWGNGAWVHTRAYSTGYQIMARGVPSASLAGHLARSKSLNGGK